MVSFLKCYCARPILPGYSPKAVKSIARRFLEALGPEIRLLV